MPGIRRGKRDSFGLVIAFCFVMETMLISSSVMIKELELNETQAAQFRVVMDEQQKGMQAQMEEFRKEANGERPSKEQMEKMRAKFQEQQEAINIVLQVILTEEQFAKYQEMNQRRLNRRGRQFRPRGNREDGSDDFPERTE